MEHCKRAAIPCFHVILGSIFLANVGGSEMSFQFKNTKIFNMITDRQNKNLITKTEKSEKEMQKKTAVQSVSISLQLAVNSCQQ